MIVEYELGREQRDGFGEMRRWWLVNGDMETATVILITVDLYVLQKTTQAATR